MAIAVGFAIAFAIIVGIYILHLRLHQRTVAGWERKLLRFIDSERFDKRGHSAAARRHSK
jgi:hypothetical protein